MSEGSTLLTIKDQMIISNYCSMILSQVKMPEDFYDDLGWDKPTREQQFKTFIYNKIYECVARILEDHQKKVEDKNESISW